MNELTKVAIAKVIKEKALKAARASIESGEYRIDSTVSIKGTIRVGEDSEAIQANKVPWEALVSVLASKVNDETLAKAVEQACGVVDTTAIKEKAKALVDNLKGETTSLRKGQVTTKLQIEELQTSMSVM